MFDSRWRFVFWNGFILLALAAVGLIGGVRSVEAAGATPSVNHLDLLKTISGARGKVVVVNFFASWCSVCLDELPQLNELRLRYAADRVLMVGVSLDTDPVALDELTKRMGFNYPVYVASEDVPQVFQVQSIPKTLVYDLRGRLAANREGVWSARDLQKVMDSLLSNQGE